MNTVKLELKIHKKVMDQILELVKKSYPHECCGLLVGKSLEKMEVTEIRPIPNINLERARDRYVMDPKVWMQVDRELSEKKLQMLGTYHSHPDHPSVPSEFDREHAAGIFAHEVFSYIVVACEKGAKTWAQSWMLREATNKFEEEKLTII